MAAGCLLGLAGWCGCGGCSIGRLLSPLMDDGLYTKGVWTGRLASAPVHDYHGHTFDAAALEVETGPPLPPKLGPVPPNQGGGKMPLLSRSKELRILVLDPRGLPVGRRVRVRGTMRKNFMAVGGQGPQIYPIDRGDTTQVEAEHVILLKGEPEVLPE